MEKICIRFAGLDESTGALFLQFSLPENISIIDQTTIHGFFPKQYEVESFDELLPYMASFGYGVLAQQQTQPQEHRFTREQLEQYSMLTGTTQSVEVDSLKFPDSNIDPNQYNPDTLANPNAQVDQIRCIILEILAEEGLIPGNVK